MQNTGAKAIMCLKNKGFSFRNSISRLFKHTMIGSNSRLLSPEWDPDDHRQKSMLFCWNIDAICDGRP